MSLDSAHSTIAKDFKDSKEHVGGIGSAVGKVATDDRLKLSELRRVTGDNLNATRIANELQATPAGQALPKKLPFPLK